MEPTEPRHIDVGGAPALTGGTPREKGLIHMMNKRAELELLDAISAYFHNASPGLVPDVEIYQNAGWGCRQRDKAMMPCLFSPH
jgi:glutathione S-transferase